MFPSFRLPFFHEIFFHLEIWLALQPIPYQTRPVRDCPHWAKSRLAYICEKETKTQRGGIYARWIYHGVKPFALFRHLDLLACLSTSAGIHCSYRKDWFHALFVRWVLDKHTASLSRDLAISSFTRKITLWQQFFVTGLTDWFYWRCGLIRLFWSHRFKYISK